MTPTTPDSPQTRLAASRKALLRQMAHPDGLPNNESSPRDYSPENEFNAQRPSQSSSTWLLVKQAMLAWWQHHPAQMAVEIGRPFLNNYARAKPWQLLGIAAGAGAALVLIKPWRLVSITGLAVAAFKSTRLSTTLLSLVPRAATAQQTAHSHSPPKDKL